MKRRRFLKSTLGVTLLSLGGVSAYQVYRQSLNQSAIKTDQPLDFLTDDDVILLQALVPVMLAVRLINSKVSLQQIVFNIDSAIIRLPLSTQSELRELFDLLGYMLGRLLVANVWLNWSAADKQSIDSFLTAWRNSHLDLLQTAYKGLHKLIIGSFYSEQNSWLAIGYPGPPQISLG
jgi:hypothetical protein